MLRIDHFCIGSRHLYEGAERFRAETGLDSYDGGWFPGMGVGQRIVPLGDLCYIEIESVIDRDMATSHFFGKWFEDVLAAASREDRFMGWALAVDSMDELRELSQRIGSPLSDILGRSGDGAAWGRRRPNGKTHRVRVVPGVRDHGWPRGLPQICLWEDVVADHPDTIAEAATVAHTVQPNGISWVEVGDEAATRAWIGPAITEIDIRFRDAPAGLYAVGIRAESAEIVVRREPAPLELGRLFGR